MADWSLEHIARVRNKAATGDDWDIMLAAAPDQSSEDEKEGQA